MNQKKLKNARCEKHGRTRRAAGILGLLSAGGALLVGTKLYQRANEANGPMLTLTRFQASDQEVAPNAERDRDEALNAVVTSRVDVNTLQLGNNTASASAARTDVATFLTASGRNLPDWMPTEAPSVWTRIVPGENTPEGVIGVDAARNSDGAEVWLINHSMRRIEANVRIRLPRGVYKIDRLTLGADRRIARTNSLSSENETRLVTHGTVQPLSSSRLQASASMDHGMIRGRIERMHGADLTSANVIAKRYTLEPGQVCVYRYADQARVAGRAWYAVYDRLHRLAASKPGPSRRLRRMMQEAEAHLAGLRGGNISSRKSRRNRSASGRLSAIHRLLLVTGQAEALARNLQTRGVFPKAEGTALMTELGRLSDALSEASATVLGLVPAISVTPPPMEQDTESKTMSHSPYMVTVALANTGSESVESVKLGLDTTHLPSGAVAQPADPAFIGALRPGQTARATFSLRNLPENGSANAESCVGDVSYFKAGTPAHLRPRSF